MQACNCGHYKDADTDDLKTHIQITVPLHCKAAYLAAGYTIVIEDAFMITVRNKIYKNIK